MGGAVTLRCQWGAAHPPPTEVTWFREGVPLPSPPHTGPVLRLRGPRPEQGGQYECEVRNVAGGVRSAPYRLEVLCECAPMGPRWDPQPLWVSHPNNPNGTPYNPTFRSSDPT